VSLSSGAGHTCAITDQATVKCWGQNGSGQIGTGAIGQAVTVPAEVPGVTGVISVSGGEAHSCVLLDDRTVRCWGQNDYGQIGNGEAGADVLSPTSVDGLPVDIIGISLGWKHSCALTTEGRMLCWGGNDLGEVGHGGLEAMVTIPTEVSGLQTGVAGIAPGANQHQCVVLDTGMVRCWGFNPVGEIGNGLGAGNILLTPRRVTLLEDSVSQIGVGENHTCALTGSGGVKCWGSTYHGQLGNGVSAVWYDRPVVHDVIGLGTGVVHLSSGENHNCALTDQAVVNCWGKGYGATPVNVPFPNDVTAETMTLGAGHGCALSDEGDVLCWGDNTRGQLGIGTQGGFSSNPAVTTGLPSGIAAVTSGRDHTCALSPVGLVYCWGNNYLNQAAPNLENAVTVPTQVAGLENVIAISTARESSCALTDTGAVLCWGKSGQATFTSPTEIMGLTGAVSAIAGECAITVEQELECWGDQGGNGTEIDNYVKAGLPNLTGPVAGYWSSGNHAVILTPEGGVKAWGANQFGQADSWSLAPRIPQDVVGFQ
jgi:alpha-tubulin suppressor-like RCC1 family protein